MVLGMVMGTVETTPLSLVLHSSFSFLAADLNNIRSGAVDLHRSRTYYINVQMKRKQTDPTLNMTVYY